MEILAEIFHDLQVSVYGSLRVITTLEFLQLVTHKNMPPEPDGHSLY